MGWEVIEFPNAARAQEGFVTYCSTSNRINIEHPISWIREVQQRSNPRVSVTSPDGKAGVTIATTVFNVMNIPPGASQNAGDAVQNYRNSLNGFTLISGGPLSISIFQQMMDSFHVAYAC